MQGKTWLRIVSVAMLAMLAVVLTACGSSKSSSSSSSSSTTASAPAASTAATSTPAASSGPGVGKPAITIGDKNFAEENILGALYTQALAAGAGVVR